MNVARRAEESLKTRENPAGFAFFGSFLPTRESIKQSLAHFRPILRRWHGSTCSRWRELICTMIQPNVVKSDSLARILERALDEGNGLLRLTPTWVPRSLLASRASGSSCIPDDLVRLRRPPRRHRRALVRQHDRSGQRRPRAGTRGSASARSKASSFCCATPSPRRATGSSARRCSSKYNRWPVYSKFFDNMGPIPHHMHQGFERRQARRPGRQAGELLLPAAVQQRRQQFRLHVHGPGAGHDEGTTSASASRIGTRATTAFSICRGPIA